MAVVDVCSDLSPVMGFSDLSIPTIPMIKTSRCSLSIKEKATILELVEEKRMKKTEIAERFGMPKSTLWSLIKNKEKILNAFRLTKDPSRKRLRAGAYPVLEEKLFEWICEVSSRGYVINSQQFKIKTEEYATRLGIPNFKMSVGWMHNFKRRHGLKFSKSGIKFPFFETELNSSISTSDDALLRTTVNNDSDGAGSERSSDSESSVHPVQLLQSERPKRLKRSLNECRPDFIFYDKGLPNRQTEQLIVPHVQNNVQHEWADHYDEDEVHHPQVKIEELDDSPLEKEFDDLSCSENEEDRRELESNQLVQVVSLPEPRPPPAPEPTPTDRTNTGMNGTTASNSSNNVIPDVAEKALMVATNIGSAVERGSGLVISQAIHSQCPAHNCQALERLAASLEVQNRIQEEMLCIKKRKLSTAQKHKEEEINLLKQKLDVEEKKVAALEQLLAAFLQQSKNA